MGEEIARQRARGLFIAIAACLVLLAAATWSWQGRVARDARQIEFKDEPWDHVKEEYPITNTSLATPTLSPELADTVVRANPFSPKRRLTPPPATPAGATGGIGQTASQAAPASFIYKGRINLGNRQRAIVEETRSGKTYFLEVGQEVAGFKVLDIGENRVVLSDPQTNEQVEVSLASPSGS